MNRFITFNALALRVRSQGESNREGFFLTAEAGVLRATVYGGPKSKLRSYVSPFHSGTLYLYHEPVRDSYKVSDFDVALWRPGLRELYERAAAAQAVAETVLAGEGGGADWKAALELTNATLDALENADGETARRVTVQFLWNWSAILGVRPDISAASNVKNPGALHWLRVVENLPPALLSRYTLDEVSLQYARTLCTDILAGAFGRRLSAWDGI
jgi:DNA repair protein RecO (recombination protein O)